MADDPPVRRVLTGFPDAAIHFLRALEVNRNRIALDHGLTSVELRTMFRVGEAGNLMPKELAADLSLTNGAITGISSRLVSAGLLRRTAHPNDRRSIHLELTDAGHEVVTGIHKDFTAMVDAATHELTGAEVDVAAESLRAVTRAIRERLAAEPG
jgi:DNA-binding MarR family transcriptional regulator